MKIIFDPLKKLVETKEFLNYDNFDNQFEFRKYYEKYRDSEKEILIYVTSNEKYDFIKNYLLDIIAHSKIEEHIPSKILSSEFNINFPVWIDDIITKSDELQTFQNYLVVKKIANQNMSDENIKDLLLESLFNIPQGELSHLDEYKSLSILSNLDPKHILQNRLKNRLKNYKKIADMQLLDIQKFKNYFWVKIFLEQSSIKNIHPRTILGQSVQNFLEVDSNIIKETFNYIIKDLDFAREEIKKLTLSNKQIDVLLELMEIGNDVLFNYALKKKIEILNNKKEKQEEIKLSEIENLKVHLFSLEYSDEIKNLEIYFEISNKLKMIERKTLEMEFDIETIKNIYIKEIAPLILNIDKMMKAGFNLPSGLTEKYSDIMHLFDKKLSDIILDNSKKGIIDKNLLLFPSFLRKYFEKYGKSIIIYIDALPCDLWIYLKDKIEKNGFTLAEEEYLTSILPTETKFNKKSLFLGYFQEGYDPDKDDLSKSFGINKDEIHFEKLSDKLDKGKLKELLNIPLWKMLILSYNIIDERIKGPLAPGDLLSALDELYQKLLPVFEYLKNNHIPFFIVTDHGIRELYSPEVIDLKIKDIPNLRWIEKEKVQDKPSSENYIEFDKKYIAVGNSTFKKSPVCYAHGGVSLREYIVPLAVLTASTKLFDKPEVNLQTVEVVEKNICEIKFLIYNPNKALLQIKKFSIELIDLPIDNLWIPPKENLEIKETKEVKFNISIAKIPEFSKDERIERVAKKIKVYMEFYFSESTIQCEDYEFEIEVVKNIKEIERSLDKEIKELL